MKLPKSINNLIEHFQNLPGIGPKTAQRLTFHLLNFPQDYLERFGESLSELKKETKICEVCKNVGESSVCSICSDSGRNSNTILVVSSPMDVFALERTDFKGTYHVLHGLIDPLNSIGPEDIFMFELFDRLDELVSSSANLPVELIIGTNSSMEGESTAMYISKQLREKGLDDSLIKITRIARGLPVGGDIEYADEITLSRALEGRSLF